MKSLIVYAAATVAGGSASAASGVPSWLYGIGTLVGAFGFLRFYWLPRAEKRLKEASASETERKGDRVAVDTAHETVEFVREEYRRVQDQMQVERTRADEAHGKLVGTQASLAQAQAQLAETVSRAASDRQNMQRQLHAVEEQLHVEQRRGALLSDELDTVKAQLGTKERRSQKRRANDPPSHESRVHRAAPAPESA